VLVSLVWVRIYVFQVNIKYIILLKKYQLKYFIASTPTPRQAMPYYPLHITCIHSNFGNKCHEKRHERENSNIKWKTSNKTLKQASQVSQAHSRNKKQFYEKKCTDETSTKIAGLAVFVVVSSFLNKAYTLIHKQT